jgi:hypothetical protein
VGIDHPDVADDLGKASIAGEPLDVRRSVGVTIGV